MLVIDWLTTLPTLVSFGAALAIGDVALRCARLSGERAIEVAAGAAQRLVIWSFLPSGVRLRVDRHPGIERRRGYVFLSNHQSMFDIPIFGGVLLSNFPKYISKKELARWIPLVSFNLRHGGHALIDRARGSEAVKIIRDFGRRCQERGVSPVIFPEGTRSRDGELKPFKPAGVTTLLEAADELPVVPTTIDGSWKLLSKRMFPIPFGTEVRIAFGKPILRRAGETVDGIVDQVGDTIAQNLSAWRAEAAV